ncbi:hypothetical protein BU24DRAFT_351088 [Aaosphaeria arxii CBS 175.79]|uniref:CHRD domain-containing protein n=1 Tax=Aaosphaeria arxii CBS 175.79 TaxID=1450172 RepID=A0A6A5XM06_9PLEO|nr:uncharacterized protein BU24DRAFT_351088 [Aaosphaeria arxii CBS 175.79]KAF2013946.1 hypothetical protein BU24DRAFT_351088 [Aaosphaeria arxii CBS 175.79]
MASLALCAAAVPLDLSSGRVTLQLDLDLGQHGAFAQGGVADPIFTFTSQHLVHAEPGQVVDDVTPTGGLAGASGTFNFGLNSHLNMICYNITLHNFQGDFESPANTATHIHEAARGASGPPRIAFPNPAPVDAAGTVRSTVGCLTGPFVTGVMVEDKDSGEGFHVQQIEANPAAFFADVHSSLALPGAVRGQIA